MSAETLVRMPTRNDAERAASSFQRVKRRRAGLAHGPCRSNVQQGNVWYLEISAGAIRLGERRASLWEDEAWVSDNDSMDQDEKPTRGKVERWSPASLNRMVYRLATLDYNPLFTDGGKPIMLTLTLPKRWVEIAPDPKAFQSLLKAFLMRFQRAYGYRPAGVWKREFQKRGAPHFHILMTPPSGRARGTGMRFSEWVGPTWAQVCLPRSYDARDEEQLAKYREHAIDGVSVETANFEDPDLDELMHQYELHERIGAHTSEHNFIDPARVAAYFTKHGAYASKGYQNEPPEAWKDLDVGAGRYWGYWQLEVTSVKVEIDADDPDDDGPDFPGGGANSPRGPLPGNGNGGTDKSRIIGTTRSSVLVGRALRHLSRSRSYMRTEKVWREKVNYETGEVHGKYRNVKRRYDVLGGRSKGYLVVNDGPAVASQISRYLVRQQLGCGAALGPLTERQARIIELRDRSEKGRW